MNRLCPGVAGQPGCIRAVLRTLTLTLTLPLALLGACSGGRSSKGTDADAGPSGAVDAQVEVTVETAAEASGETAGADPACQMIERDATRTVNLRITADNECEVFVNGTSVGMTNSWPTAVTIDVSLFVHPGRRNVIAVRGVNTSSQPGNDRGIIGELASKTDGGSMVVIVTDTAWKVAKTEQAGWTELAFDDSAWEAATAIADSKAPPWGAVLGETTASWIWSDAVPQNVAEKPNVETAWTRRTFYFASDGTTVTNMPGCPVQ